MLFIEKSQINQNQNLKSINEDLEIASHKKPKKLNLKRVEKT